jgi:superkiller protein 3
LNRAEDALEAGDVGTTLSLLKGRVHDSVRGLKILGRAYMALGEFGNARAAFRRAAELEPRDVSAWLAVAESAERERYFDHALDAYKKALAADVNSVEARRRLAFLLADLGRLSDAASALRLALEVAPQDVDIRLRLGAVELRRGRAEEAEAAYTAVIDGAKAPIAEAFLGRGLARTAGAQALKLDSGPAVDAAEADLTRASELARDAADGPYNLGWFKEEVRHDVQGAEASYREALRRHADHLDSILRLAVLVEARKDLDEALALYKRALELNPSPLVRPALVDRVDELSKKASSAPATRPASSPAGGP